MKYVFLTLFLTIAALGQPVIGPEITSAPLDGLGQFALAPQRDGFLVAWEQNGRIHAGRLDSALRLEGALELPGVRGWTERERSVDRDERYQRADHLARVRVWTAGHQRRGNGPHRCALAAPRSAKLDAVNTAAIAAWGGASYVVYSADYEYRVTDSLDVSLAGGWPHGMSAALSSDGNPATATENQGSELMCFHFGPLGGHGDCTPQLIYTFSVRSGKVQATYSPTVKAGTSVPLAPPIVAANGTSFAALVRLPAQTDVLLFDDILRKRTTLPVTILTDAAIAGNGGDVLTVWTAQQQLTGILTHADGSVSEPFDIRDGAIDEPHVIAAGSNTFVVFYRVNPGRLAGRVIHLQPSKQRAIR